MAGHARVILDSKAALSLAMLGKERPALHPVSDSCGCCLEGSTMDDARPEPRWRIPGCLGALLLLIGAHGMALTWPPGVAAQDDVIGVMAEIKAGSGGVEVQSRRTGTWRRAAPLLALYVGDSVRATGDAFTIIVLRGASAVRVDAKHSPFVVPAPEESTAGERARSAWDASVRFLVGRSASPSFVPVSTRRGVPAPRIIAPRNSVVLPGTLAIEWRGNDLARYTLTIAGPAGLIVERQDLRGFRLDMPVDGPLIVPGVRYTIRLTAAGHPPEEAWFTVLQPSEVLLVRRALDELTQELGPTLAPPSRTMLQAGLLASLGLMHDARLQVLSALAVDTADPALYWVLALIYRETGTARACHRGGARGQGSHVGGRLQRVSLAPQLKYRPKHPSTRTHATISNAPAAGSWKSSCRRPTSGNDPPDRGRRAVAVGVLCRSDADPTCSASTPTRRPWRCPGRRSRAPPCPRSR